MILVDTGPIVLFLEDLRVGHFTLIESFSVDLRRVADLVKQYSNLPLGTVDASVIALAERLQITMIATLDKRDFSTVQPAHVPAFTLLP